MLADTRRSVLPQIHRLNATVWAALCISACALNAGAAEPDAKGEPIPFPEIRLAQGQADPTNQLPISFVVDFMQDVTGFDGQDVLLSGSANPSGFTIFGGPQAYTIIISQTASDGTVQVDIPEAAAIDRFENPTPAPIVIDNSVILDQTPPLVTIGAPMPSLTRSGPVEFPVTIEGGTMIDFDSLDVSVTTPSAVIVGSVEVEPVNPPTEYRVIIDQMTGNGATGILIREGIAADDAGNLSEAAGPSDLVTVDNLPPTVAIGLPSPSDSRQGPVEFQLTFFNADAIDLQNEDVVVNASGTAIVGDVAVTGDGLQSRLVTLSGLAGDGAVSITIPAGTASDNAGNQSNAATSAEVNVDNTAPTVVLGAPNPPATNLLPIEFSAAFSGASEISLTPDDVIVLTTGTATHSHVLISGAGLDSRIVGVYGAMGDGTISVALVANVARDLAGNMTAATPSSPQARVDNTPPTVVVNQAEGQADPTNQTPIVFDILFSEPVTGFGSQDIILGGDLTPLSTTLSMPSPTSYRISFLGFTANGTITVSIRPDAVVDEAGNSSQASSGGDNSVTFDNTPPVIAIDAPNPLVVERDPAAAFVAPPSIATDNIDGDISSAVQTSGVESVDLSIVGDYDVVYSVADAAGNAAEETLAVHVRDTTRPTVVINRAIDQSSPTNTAPIEFTVTFSEPIAGLTAEEFTFDGAAQIGESPIQLVPASGNGQTFTLIVSEILSDGSILPALPAEAAADPTGNLSEASTIGDGGVEFDTTAPTLTVEQAAGQADPTSDFPIVFDIVFSETVTEFDASAVVFNGTATNIVHELEQLSETDYRLNITAANGDGATIVPSVPAASLTDDAGNANAESSSADNSVTLIEHLTGDLSFTPGIGDFGIVSLGEPETIMFRLDYTGFGDCAGAIFLRETIPPVDIVMDYPSAQPRDDGGFDFVVQPGLDPDGGERFTLTFTGESGELGPFDGIVDIELDNGDTVSIPFRGKVEEAVGRVRGRVFNPDGSVADCATVRIQDLTGGAADIPFDRVVVTDNQGFYSMSRVPADRELIVSVYATTGATFDGGIFTNNATAFTTVVNEDCGPAEGLDNFAALLTVQQDATHNINFQLTELEPVFFEIAGTAIDAISGEPLGGVPVEYFLLGPDSASTLLACTFSCASGEFRLFVHPSALKVPSRIGVGGTQIEFDTDDFPDGFANFGNITVGSENSENPGFIVGLVTNQDGNPIAGAQVIAQLVNSTQTQSRTRTTLTSAEPGSVGIFMLNQMVTGQYQISASALNAIPSNERFVNVLADATTEIAEPFVVIEFEPPIANAGEDIEVNADFSTGRAIVQLDGSASMPPLGVAEIRSYAWRGGADSPTPMPQAVMPNPLDLLPGNYVFFLTVTVEADGAFVESNPDRIDVFVDTPNPIANAGQNRVRVLGEFDTEVTVMLDASASIAADGFSIAAYAWSNADAGGPIPDPANAAMTSVTLGEGVHTFNLVVTDTADNMSAPASVTIMVLRSPIDPIADAGGDQAVTVDPLTGLAEVLLDGSQSLAFNEADIVTYDWTALDGDDPDPEDIAITTVSLAPGAHAYELVVTDSGGRASEPDVALITVQAVLPAAPEVTAPALTQVCPNELAIITFNAMADTRFGEVDTFIWEGLNGAPDPDDVQSPMLMLEPGQYIFQSRVRYMNGLLSENAEIMVMITDDSQMCSGGCSSGSATTGYRGSAGDLLSALFAAITLLLIGRRKQLATINR